MKSKIYHLHALTAVHVGIGQGSGVVDLPIARERASGLPMVPGSGVKGVLCEELKPDDKGEQQKQWFALFGPDTDAGNDLHASALALSDARLLCLPTRSLRGTFAYATCAMVLRRYARDLSADEQSGMVIPDLDDGQAATYSESALTDDNKVYLEDLDFSCTQEHVDSWADFIAQRVFPNDEAWQKLFKQRFIVLDDMSFDFLAETATEIRARIKLQENTRTVQKGALWYEELLPAESILWGVAACDRSFKPGYVVSADNMLAQLPVVHELQIGGKATVGHGRVRWLLA